MNKKDEPYDVGECWQKVIAGQNYNMRINYYKMVDENYAFVSGDQWRGVKANGLPTPVVNIIKRVRDYKVASLMSNKIKGKFSIENISSKTKDEDELKAMVIVEQINKFIMIQWEKQKIDKKIREGLQDSFTVGDFYFYTYWDSSIKTGQTADGDFKTDLFDGVNVLFGNPNCSEVEKQPYILLLGRDSCENLKAEAKRNGISSAEAQKIVPDTNTEYEAGQYGKIELEKKNEGSGKCGYSIKLWKENGKVYHKKSTRYADISKKTDSKLSRYPITSYNWERVKNSYHGRGECTGMIPNQKYINKQYAMLMLWMMFNALGKVAYDKTKINGWSNQIGVAVPVNGDIGGSIQQLSAGSINNGVFDLLNIVTKETLQALGVNDVVMGDINPENTSAIIAVQKQSAVPLENQKAALYEFVEDQFLIWSDFIVNYYNVDRKIPQTAEGEELDYVVFNGEPLKKFLLSAKIDVGASSHWSEISEIQTLDQLLTNQHIDIIQYLERIPKGYVPQKDALIDEIKERMRAEMEAQQQAPQEAPQEAMGKDEQYQQMAQIIENLPPEEQEAFMRLSPQEQDQFIEEYLNESATIPKGE